jgi:hypothetical protein
LTSYAKPTPTLNAPNITLQSTKVNTPLALHFPSFFDVDKVVWTQTKTIKMLLQFLTKHLTKHDNAKMERHA